MNDREIGLTEHGISQAEVAAGKAYYSSMKERSVLMYSGYKRAKDTADIISTTMIRKYGHFFAEHIEHPLLHERVWGNLGETKDFSLEYDPNVHFDFYYRPLYGESFADLYQRVSTFFSELNRYPDGTYVIVTHGEWMRVASLYFKGLSENSIQEFSTNRKNPDNCEILYFTM
jgi:broad specificity phosphatase PhoE